jgi:hypothetical protein
MMLGDVVKELHYWDMEKAIDEAVEKAIPKA